MNILYYSDINYSSVKKQFQKVVGFLENDDFDSAEIKKLTNFGLYRAKLDYENRLLFKFAKYNNKTYLLLLEVIYKHEYEKSRFLRGAKIDENKLIALKSKNDVPDEEKVSLNYINPKSNRFHLLNKIVSFDDVQKKLFSVKPPVVIIGSAGSGKTILTLEKIKALKGNILYITLSPFLVENSSKIYYAENYFNEKQNVDFLSFIEYLETYKVMVGKPLGFKTFDKWLHPRKKTLGIKESYKLFEEFRGVLTGLDITKDFLSREDYYKLGVKQSIFLGNERAKVYDSFLKYLDFIRENDFYDLNMVAFRWLQNIKPRYDFIVIDEVQDFTNIQLFAILKSLKTAENFILCGDANQIVHPNFFSWSNVKTMFYKHNIADSEIKVLRTNYRNSVDITTIANKLLMIKNNRFGSIDKESTYLINALKENKGAVNFYNQSPKMWKQLNDKTVRSTKYAVIVMSEDEKIKAKSIFKTPLLFSIHEAKGLEYENIILLNFISNYSREFNRIAEGISRKNLENEQLVFSRGKDKSDKSLDAYKFYINSLYVGITRAIKNLFILETQNKHNLLTLLDLVEAKENIRIKEEISSLDDWKEEARKLELQGKKEQSDEIKKTILELQKPDWKPITPNNVDELKAKALDPKNFNKKAKDMLFAYALLFNDNDSIEKLAILKYRKAEKPDFERSSIVRKYYSDYNSDNVKSIEQKIKKYGVDYRDRFNLTPLLSAVEAGSIKILDFLLNQNAVTDVLDNAGRSPLRIALNKAYFSKLNTAHLGDFYTRLLTENIKIRINNKMIKIHNRKMEYFLLHFFITLQDSIINDMHRRQHILTGVTAMDIQKIVSNYPETVLPDYRKKRTYISSMLAKNEVDSANMYNRSLFIRTQRGFYCLNPDISLLADGEWKNIYDLTGLKKRKKLTMEEQHKLYLQIAIDNIKLILKENPEDAHFYKDLLANYEHEMNNLKNN